MRLIDGDEARRRIVALATGLHSEVLPVDTVMMLLAQETVVDAVSVVRCKDCEYSTLPSKQTQIYGKPGTLTCHNRKSPCNRRNVASDDYCSHGEKNSEVNT